MEIVWWLTSHEVLRAFVASHSLAPSPPAVSLLCDAEEQNKHTTWFMFICLVMGHPFAFLKNTFSHFGPKSSG